MGTSREIIRAWYEYGEQKNATHMIVVCDTFDHEDYPTYVMPDEDVRAKYAEYDGPNMQRVMEVYSYKLDKEMQLAEHRSYHFD